MRFLYGDITADGTQVGANPSTRAVAFGTKDISLGSEGGMFVRATQFAGEHVAIVRTHQTDRAKLVTDTGRIIDLGPNVGNWSVILRPSIDGSILRVLWMETTTSYKHRIYRSDWGVQTTGTITCPNTSTGFRDVTNLGEPIFTDSRTDVKIAGINTRYSIERKGVWVAQRVEPGHPDALIAIKGTTVKVLYPGLAHEPYLTEAPDGSLLVAFRAEGLGAKFLKLNPETLASTQW